VRRFYRLLFFGVCAVGLSVVPLFAQTTGAAAPSSTGLSHILEQGAALGAFIFAIIQGAKNVPFLAPIFDKYPQIAVWANAVASLLATAVTCVATTGINWGCLLTAVMAFLSAAGIHLTVQTIGGASAPSN
jgi:hypothetical protein